MAQRDASIDDNFKPTLIAVSTADGVTPVALEADPVTGNLQVDASVSVSGADGAIVDGSSSSIKATVKDLTNSNPLTVAITDGNGDQITSFGGGTQYTEGDTDASITGTALMMEDGSNTLRAATGNTTNGLDVDVTRVQGTVTVDGSGVTQPVSHAALTELAAAIDTEVQVDVVGALPAGNNNIGDVDVASLPSTVHSEDYDTGAGTDTTLAFGIALPASGGAVAGGTSTNPLRVDPTGTTAQPVTDNGGSLTVDNAGLTSLNGAISGTEVQVDVVGALPAGDNNIGNVDIVTLPGDVEADIDQIRDQIDLITPDVEEIRVDADAIRVAVEIIDDWDESDRAKVNPIVGQAGVAAGEGAVAATVQRVTEAGHTPFYNLDVDESEDAIKASAGTLQGFVAINRTASIVYLKFYNATVANVTVGTTTPHITIPVPANADSDGAGFVWNKPIRFDTAITIAATTGFADNDTGAPGANDLIVSGVYD